MKSRATNKPALLLLTLLSMLVSFAKAQSNLVFYQTNEQFNSSGYNPAFLTSQEKFTFSLFPLAGMSVGYNNQSLINGMLLKVLRGDTSKQAFKDIFKGLVEHGLFYQKFESTLLNFGYNSGIGSFNFRIREVELLMNNFKGNFTDFLMNPDVQTIYLNRPQLLPAEALHYREYSLGFAREVIKNKLTVGFRAKLYFGKASFVSEVAGSAVMQNDTFYMRTTGLIKLSAPVNVVTDNEILQPFVLSDTFTAGNYLLNSKNLGAGLDFGFTFRINPRTIISASVVDLGKINWKNNLNTIIFKGEYMFPIEYTQAQGPDFLTKKPGFTTEIENNFDLFKIDKAKQTFSTTLPTTFYAGIKYQINPNLNIGFVDRFIYVKNMSHHSLSVLTNYEVNKKVKISTGYALIGNSFFNIPAGVLYDWGSGQTYLGTDNIFSFLLPSVSDFAGITFGTCFYPFQSKTKYKIDEEYLPFYKEKKINPVIKDHKKSIFQKLFSWL